MKVGRSVIARISATTISTLSVPMPVETTETRWPRYRPVTEANSRWRCSSSMESKREAIRAVRSGSPGRRMYSASSPGPSPMWYCRSPVGIAIRRSGGFSTRVIRVRQDLSLAQVAASQARNSAEDSPAFSRASSRVGRAWIVLSHVATTGPSVRRGRRRARERGQAERPTRAARRRCRCRRRRTVTTRATRADSRDDESERPADARGAVAQGTARTPADRRDADGRRRRASSALGTGSAAAAASARASAVAVARQRSPRRDRRPRRRSPSRRASTRPITLTASPGSMSGEELGGRARAGRRGPMAVPSSSVNPSGRSSTTRPPTRTVRPTSAAEVDRGPRPGRTAGAPRTAATRRRPVAPAPVPAPSRRRRRRRGRRPPSRRSRRRARRPPTAAGSRTVGRSRSGYGRRTIPTTVASRPSTRADRPGSRPRPARRRPRSPSRPGARRAIARRACGRRRSGPRTVTSRHSWAAPGLERSVTGAGTGGTSPVVRRRRRLDPGGAVGPPDRPFDPEPRADPPARRRPSAAGPRSRPTRPGRRSGARSCRAGSPARSRPPRWRRRGPAWRAPARSTPRRAARRRPRSAWPRPTASGASTASAWGSASRPGRRRARRRRDRGPRSDTRRARPCASPAGRPIPMTR